MSPILATAEQNKTNIESVDLRLMDIYWLISQSELKIALDKAHSLVQQKPNFQLAHLVYADLLQTYAGKKLQDTQSLNEDQKTAMQNLIDESKQRIKGLLDGPSISNIPKHFINIHENIRHAIAVDASISRLYLFENQSTGLKLIADYYVSLGKLGVGKDIEGDQRTPLGIYFITSKIDKKLLTDFYGIGALQLNYPNRLDKSRGKTGSGIWLHGTPSEQFARPPNSTDGCIVLSNPDMEEIMNIVNTQSTPMVIAKKLSWMPSLAARQQVKDFEQTFKKWKSEKLNSDQNMYGPYYFKIPVIENQNKMTKSNNKAKAFTDKNNQSLLKDESFFYWNDEVETMLVTYTEIIPGNTNKINIHQYWVKREKQWKIFHEDIF